MNKYIITYEHAKNKTKIKLLSYGSDEDEAKRFARSFINGNCKFICIKCLSDARDE